MINETNCAQNLTIRKNGYQGFSLFPFLPEKSILQKNVGTKKAFGNFDFRSKVRRTKMWFCCKTQGFLLGQDQEAQLQAEKVLDKTSSGGLCKYLFSLLKNMYR